MSARGPRPRWGAGLVLACVLLGACMRGPPLDQLPPPPPPGVDAGPEPCLGVTGPCLTHQGSTEQEDVRVGESGISNLVTDVLLREGSRVAGEPIDAALLNAGAFRGGLSLGPPDFSFTDENARIGRTYGPGPLSEEDVRGWLPFPDTYVVLTVTGAQLKRSLESGMRTWADDAGLNFGPDLLVGRAGNLLHVAGMRYEVTCPGTTRITLGPPGCDVRAGTCRYVNAEEADSISRLEVGGTVLYDARAGGWVAGGETRPIRILTSAFVAEGLDAHLDFPEGTNLIALPPEQLDLPGLVLQELTQHTPTTLNGRQGRISVVGTVMGLPCNLPVTCLPAHRLHPNCAHLSRQDRQP